MADLDNLRERLNEKVVVERSDDPVTRTTTIRATLGVTAQHTLTERTLVQCRDGAERLLAEVEETMRREVVATFIDWLEGSDG